MKIELTQNVIDAQAGAERALEDVKKIDAAINDNAIKLAQAKSDLDAITAERNAAEAERAIECDEKVATALDKKISAINKRVADQAEVLARLERLEGALLIKGREHDRQIASAKASLAATLDEFNLNVRKQLSIEMRSALAPYMHVLHKCLAISAALGESSIWHAVAKTLIADPSDSMHPIIDGNRRNNGDGSHTELNHAWRADSHAMEIFQALKEPKAMLGKFAGHKAVDERLAASVPYVLKGYEIRGSNRAVPADDTPQPSLVGRIA